MKGAVFQGISEFIESKFGLEVWQDIIDNYELESKGEYLAGDNYNDAELMTIITALSTITNSSPEEIQRDFGSLFFKTLLSQVTPQVKHIDNLFDFLRSVDSVIHVEVKKSDPMAYLPSLFYDQPDKNILVIRYLSVRKMCYFAEGLIMGAANHFNQKVNIVQNQCMHEGADCCLIQVAL